MKLSKGSYFGDFHVLFKTKAGNMSYMAGTARLRTHKVASLHSVSVMLLDGPKFKQICNDFPEFGQQMRQRAMIRRSHFKKIVEEYKASYTEQWEKKKVKVLSDFYEKRESLMSVGGPFSLDQKHADDGEVMPQDKGDFEVFGEE